MRRAGDKLEVRAAIVRAACAAHPGVLERDDLDREPAIARADGRTVQGEIRRLVSAGVIAVVDVEYPSGRPTRLRAMNAPALAVQTILELMSAGARA